ncbi:hypothetical protein HIM_05197 [Hirsutella minnesotensis 3608]|uniref:Carrier domain-containing protein n=1 Tax=Hirsutella minnesotensis 3608 TaxID=1043627 RepID=A0A0F7ZKQ2_9HYPO|nr:hypothetical protein HIM_05197 [Hirsutella minnesotensis 3608]
MAVKAELGSPSADESRRFARYTDYAALHDHTLPHLPVELYSRWKSYGNMRAITSPNGEHTSYSRLVRDVEGRYAALSKGGLQGRDVVALGGSMCVDMVTTVVACWLKGLTVVLLDEDLPKDRRRRLLDVVAPSLMVGDDEVARAFPNARQSTYGEIMGAPEPIRSAVTVDAAYIVFTSGSTGEPKPILGSHQGLAHFICWQSREFAIAQHDRFAQLTAVGFDVIYRSVFTPLYCGAQLWIPPCTVSDGQVMLEWLCRHGINGVHIVPCIIKAWLSLCTEIDLPDLRWIFSAGEMLHGKVLQDICRQWAFAGQLVNLYGPSETTLAKNFYRCKASDAVRGVLPAGIPLPNTEIWIMDGQRRCVPGEQGEVVIRTPYRSLGYLSARGAVAREAFRPTPNVQRESSGQLCYTGDLGHCDEDGLLHLHGRMDDQIKINGVRIEPGEIEAFLHRIPQVEEGAVCHHGGLVAYLAGPDSLSADDINRKLSQAFPAVMRPRVMIRRWLPTNANGKVDRLALKTWLNRSAIARPAAGPVGKTETLMVHLWQKHLGSEAVVGRDDDFFALGGNSISAIIMGAENRRTGKQIPLKDLFQFSRLADFYRYVDDVACHSGESEKATISHDAANAHEPFGLTDVQRAYLIGRDPALELGGVSTHNYHEDGFARLDVELLGRCVNQLISCRIDI